MGTRPSTGQHKDRWKSPTSFLDICTSTPGLGLVIVPVLPGVLLGSRFIRSLETSIGPAEVSLVSTGTRRLLLSLRLT